jgi:O-antigen ligase
VSEGVAPARRAAATSPLLAAGGFAIIAAAAVTGVGLNGSAAAVAGSLFLAAIAVRKPVLEWRHLLVGLLLVILFIPIRRYRVPGDLPFQLEPYRVVVALLVAGWIASLLVDPAVRLRRSGLELPIVLVGITTVASVLANPQRVNALQPTVLKSLTFLLSFVLVFYLVVSVVRAPAVIGAVVKTLVAGGAVVAVLAIVEARTGATLFTRLDAILPFLTPDPSFQPEIDRGGAMRAFGPAEHPIALGAALAMLVPFAVYLVRTASPRWYVALVPLAAGVLSTVSRTSVIMLFVIGIVFLALRPRETRRLWPVLVPLLVVTQLALPGTLGSLKQAFLPEGGLIQEQRGSAGSCTSAGRIADLGPTLAEVGKKPLLGHGYGTRMTTGEEANACILDNQWLGTLLDVGVLGALAWLGLFLTVIRRWGGAARDHSDNGWLLVAATAAVTAYAVAMFTFDAFSFIQVTLLLFVVLGIGAAAAADVGLRPRRRQIYAARPRTLSPAGAE